MGCTLRGWDDGMHTRVYCWLASASMAAAASSAPWDDPWRLNMLHEENQRKCNDRRDSQLADLARERSEDALVQRAGGAGRGDGQVEQSERLGEMVAGHVVAREVEHGEQREDGPVAEPVHGVLVGGGRVGGERDLHGGVARVDGSDERGEQLGTRGERQVDAQEDGQAHGDLKT